MGDTRSGLTAAVRDAVDEADPLVDEPDIMDLFGDDPDAGSPVSESAFSVGVPDPVKRRSGRPRGAQNITTRKIIEYLQARYRHPLLGMADIAATPPAEIAQLLLQRDEEGKPITQDNGKPQRVSKDDMRWAFEFWFKVTSELSEYMATKQPRSIAELENLPPLFQVFLGMHQGGEGPVLDGELGMSKSQMISTQEDVEDAKVPET